MMNNWLPTSTYVRDDDALLAWFAVLTAQALG
jgi:hypothetical protein